MRTLVAALGIALALAGCGGRNTTVSPKVGDYSYPLPKDFEEKGLGGSVAQRADPGATAVGPKGDDADGVVVRQLSAPGAAASIGQLEGYLAPRFRKPDGSVPKAEHMRMAGRPALRFTLQSRSVGQGARVDGEAWFVLAPQGHMTVVTCQWKPDARDKVSRGCADVVRSIRISRTARRG